MSPTYDFIPTEKQVGGYLRGILSMNANTRCFGSIMERDSHRIAR